MEYNISICTENTSDKTQKERLLENLSAEILRVQQYSVVKTVRTTGMELDLLARHNYTGEEIIVECKAWETPLPSEEISKLLGNVSLRHVSAGWLITTGKLSKDAEGIKTSWEKQPSAERKRLTIYTANRIIQMLIDNRLIIHPEKLLNRLPHDFFISNTWNLFITSFGIFWVFSGSFTYGSIATTAVAYEAASGKPITNASLLEKMKILKSAFSEYTWYKDKSKSLQKQQYINDEFQNIVTVIGGDQWADYRPSRPEDYVGRKELIHNIFYFLDMIRLGQSSSRLFALKGPSGWGKSSTLLKIIHSANTRYYKNHIYIYAVDVRTAISSRYAELALKSCFEHAIHDGFVHYKAETISVGSINNITDTEDMKCIFNTLKKEHKIIVLVFDQFEELLYKRELFALFENISKILNTVNSIKENFILGFSWKTDFSIPADHPAYSLWHNLSDQRRDFDLSQFTPGEIKSALNLFQRELGEHINPILLRYLARQCQGYPWLLRKLCIHVYNTLKSGKSQDDALEQTLSIGSLFEDELTSFTKEEFACVKFIAQNSPVNIFAVTDSFGETVVQSLLNRRTVIKRATHLTLYWDIFKDYVLTGKLPEIVTDYMPQLQFSTFSRVISVLIDHPDNMTSAELAQETLLGKKTIDNILIDLAVFGIIRRHKGIITLKKRHISDIYHEIRSFFKRHIVYINLHSKMADGFDYKEYFNIFSASYPVAKISAKTQNIYCHRFLGWLLDIQLISQKHMKFTFVTNPNNIALINHTHTYKNYHRTRRNRKQELHLYWPQISPQKVKNFYELIVAGNTNALHLLSFGYKKVIEDLITLNAIIIANDTIIPLLYTEELFIKIKNMDNISYARALLFQYPDLKIAHLGEQINIKFNKGWSIGTQKVTGGMIYRWAYELNNF